MKTFLPVVRTGSLLALAFGMIAVVGAPASAEIANACPVDALPAITLSQPIDLSPIAQLQRFSGNALVRVDLDASGVPQHPVLVESTGSPSLDATALVAVLNQKYSPEIRNCRGVAGTFAVRVEF